MPEGENSLNILLTDLCNLVLESSSRSTSSLRLSEVWSTDDLGWYWSSWCVHLLDASLSIYSLQIYYAGQLKLQAASAVVVGVGGLGCPALQYLAAAGIGKFGLMHDTIIS